MAKDIHDAKKGTSESTGSKVAEQVKEGEKGKEKKQMSFWEKVVETFKPVVDILKKIWNGITGILKKFGLMKSDENSKKYLEQLGVKTFYSTEGWDPTGYDPNSPDDNSTSGYGKSLWGDTFDDHRITTQYGATDDLHPTGHKGVDLAYKKNEKVGAKVAGTVTYAGPCEGYGNLVIIEDDKQYKHYYGHLAKIGVAKDQEVTAGETIGLAGSTGHSTGVHLHYEIRKPGQKNQLAHADGYDIDPLAYLINYRRAKNATEGKQINLSNSNNLRDGSQRNDAVDEIVQRALKGDKSQDVLKNIKNKY